MSEATTVLFAPLYFEPDRSRDERLDIGLVLTRPEGVSIRLAANLQKVRALVPGYDLRNLQALAVATESALEKLPDNESRAAMLTRGFGPLRMGRSNGELYLLPGDSLDTSIEELLSFTSESAVRAPARRARQASAPLFKQLRDFFDRNMVLGSTAADVQNRVVANYPINAEAQMYAEFALKNGVFHITETIDVRTVNRSKLNESGAKAVVFDQSRRILGDNTQRYVLIASDQWADARPIVATLRPYCEHIVNYHDASDMRGWLEAMSHAAKTKLQLPTLV